MNHNNKRDWKTILEEKGFTYEEIKCLEPVCDSFTKDVIEKDPDKFINNIFDYVNPVCFGDHGFADSNEKYKKNFLEFMLLRKGYSEYSNELIYAINYNDESLIPDYRLLDPDFYNFLDGQIAVSKEVIDDITGYLSSEKDKEAERKVKVSSFLKSRINNTKYWDAVLLNSGLTSEVIDQIKSSYDLNKIPVSFANYKKIKDALKINKQDLNNHKDYSGILTCEGIYNINPERIKYLLGSKASNAALERLSMYIKSGYISKEYQDFNPKKYIYLEKRRKELLDKGYSTKDILFITMAGFLESDEEVIANELKNSAKFREENSDEFNSIISNDYPFKGIEEYANKYYKHKLNEFAIYMNDKGYTTEQIADIIKDYRYDGKLDSFNYTNHMVKMYEKRKKVYSLDYKFDKLNPYISNELFPLYKKYGNLPSAQISFLEKLYEGMTADKDMEQESIKKAEAKHELNIKNREELRSNIKKALKVAPAVIGYGTAITVTGVGVIQCLEITNFKEKALTFIESNPGFVVAGGYTIVLGSLLALLTSMPTIMHYDFGGPRQK